MDHEGSCLFRDMVGNTYAWQVYDNDHHGAIAEGAIRDSRYRKWQYLKSEIRGVISRLERCQGG
jgi:hypothetical protein